MHAAATEYLRESCIPEERSVSVKVGWRREWSIERARERTEMRSLVGSEVRKGDAIIVVD